VSGCSDCSGAAALPCPPLPQAIALAKRPHVIVGTPGRVVDHLSNTKVGGWQWERGLE
jgi:superfamily II DNA/RNA helicase